MSNRTPGKISVVALGYFGKINIVSVARRPIALCATNYASSRKEDEANAAFIARAWNCHDDLVAAVKAMQAACAEWAAEFTQGKRAMNWGIVNDAYVKAARAIAASEGVESK